MRRRTFPIATTIGISGDERRVAYLLLLIRCRRKVSAGKPDFPAAVAFVPESDPRSPTAEQARHSRSSIIGRQIGIFPRGRKNPSVGLDGTGNETRRHLHTFIESCA